MSAICVCMLSTCPRARWNPSIMNCDSDAIRANSIYGSCLVIVRGKTPTEPINQTGKWRKSKNRHSRDLRNHCTKLPKGERERGTRSWSWRLTRAIIELTPGYICIYMLSKISLESHCVSISISISISISSWKPNGLPEFHWTWGVINRLASPSAVMDASHCDIDWLPDRVIDWLIVAQIRRTCCSIHSIAGRQPSSTDSLLLAPTACNCKSICINKLSSCPA